MILVFIERYTYGCLLLWHFDNEDDLDCDLYLNDGICDLSSNSIDYQYDGGDCCVATCTDPSCGLWGITRIFGDSNVSGDGFPFCIYPSMVPVPIRLDNIFGHNDILAIDWFEFYKPSRKMNIWLKNIFKRNQIILFLSLDCDEKNMMSIYADKSIEILLRQSWLKMEPIVYWLFGVQLVILNHGFVIKPPSTISTI